jgi:putative transposase
MAIEQREAARGETVIHSDHGTQFTSWAFTERARQSGLVPSMGSIGDCYDNAMIEACWSRMQVKLLDIRRWKTRVELANAIFEYIEILHNRRRRHSSLGMLTNRIRIEEDQHHESGRLKSRNATPPMAGHSAVPVKAGPAQKERQEGGWRTALLLKTET